VNKRNGNGKEKKKVAKSGIKKRAELKIKTMKIEELKPHPQNPRKHPPKGSEQWNALKTSLEHDYFDPIVFNERNGLLVSGHLRAKVLRESGFTHADAVIKNYANDVHIARMIAANQLQGEDDFQMIKDLIEEIDTGAIDLELTGIPENEIAEMMAPDMPGEDPEIVFTEELMECHNYVCLYFDNEVDWLQAQTLLGITTVKALDSKPGFEKKGVGRVMRGPEAIQKILRGGGEA